MVTKTASSFKPAIKPAGSFGRQEIDPENYNRSLFVPASVPNPNDKNSLEMNAAEIKSVIEKKCPQGRKVKIPSGYKGFRIDQITFFTVVKKEEGFRYNPHHRERINNKCDTTYDDFVPFPMSRYFITSQREVPRVLGYSDSGVDIRVSVQELARIFKEGGNSFKFHKSKKWNDEYRIKIPFSNILEVIFIERS